MTDVVSLNKQVFGTNVLKGGISRRAKRAMAEPLQVTAGIEMTYDDCECVDGGGRFKLTLSCTAGGFVQGFTSGLVTGFVTGLVAGFSTKFGLKIGGWKGALICGALGAIVGWAISSVVNDLVYGSSGPSSVTLINIWIPFFNFTKDIDIAEEFGKAFGGFGGGAAGGALSLAVVSAAGYARGLLAGC